MTLREALPKDMPACEAIYAHHVATGTASFDEDPPVQGAMAVKHEKLRAGGYPFFVTERAGRIVGFAYAGPFRERSAYRFSVENSIYLHPDFLGQGLAAPLMQAVIEATRAQGLKTLIAVIGMDQGQDPATNASVRAHAKAGYVYAGVMDYVGYKFERWLKTVYMRRELQD